MIESFNGRQRDECLNVNEFGPLDDVREILKAWRHDYNHCRPHGSMSIRPAPRDESIQKVFTMKLSHRLLRNLHLATTPVLGAYVYASPLREDATFVAIVQWGVFPVVAVAGLLMWIRPWLARRTAEAKSP
jgi:transposase InsO family protein